MTNMAKSSTKNIRNPFIYDGYEGPDYFCDRTEETEKVIANLENGRNITLVSPRKIGKTGLIKHAFHQIKQTNNDAVCIYLDIFHTQNQHDLVQALGKAVVNEQLSERRVDTNKVLTFFSAWRPVISIDPMTGMPAVSVSIERSNTEHTLESIFSYLNNSNKEVYIAIDEFQAVTSYLEKGTEALLRSHIQFLHNVHFIFSGSKLHLMYEMFGSPERPFYQSTAMMSLAPLHEERYYDFAARFFQNRRGDLSKEVFHELYEQFNGYTWYMQSVLNRLYECEKRVTNYGQVDEAITSILTSKADQYEMLLTFLTDNQRCLVKAIAAEGTVLQPQSQEFIRNYDLPSASSVNKALAALAEKDIVYSTSNGYIIYDRFFDLWLKRIQYR